MTSAAVVGILLLALSFSIGYTAPITTETFGISDQCTCYFNELPSGRHCSRVEQNKCKYPDHEDLEISRECLPKIPKNHRVCFRTKVKECSDDNGVPSFHCRFFPSFSLKSFNQSCESSVELSSPPDSDYRTFCMYSVDLSSATNCTSIRLRHQIDYPESEYVDSLGTNPCNRDSDDTTCRDYLKIYYGESENNTRVWCRRELAELDNFLLYNATSFTAIYWTDWTRDENVTSSFRLTAECDLMIDMTR